MADLINSGNKKDKWTKRVTDLLNWLNEKKQAKLVEGENVTLTPQQDGTVEISAGGGAVALDDLTDVDVSSVTDGQALVYDETNEKWIAGESGKVDDVKVNGTSVVSNKIAEITSYKEVTQDEYDALPNSKNSDGILYCIKDNGITANNRFSPVIYSNDEREIGVWTDGKPLYQKTIHINALPSTAVTATSYPHNIANIDTICGYEAIARWSNGQIVQIPRLALYDKTTWSGTADSSFAVDTINKTNIVLLTGSNRSALSADITIRYTKTTDTAGSGTWGTDGTPMHHYDNVERIVGTWTSGETLYEKTVTIPFSDFHANGDFMIGNIRTGDFSNVNIKTIDGYLRASELGLIPLGSKFYMGSSVQTAYQIEFFMYYNDIAIYDTAGLSDLNRYTNFRAEVTVKYTKYT